MKNYLLALVSFAAVIAVVTAAGCASSPPSGGATSPQLESEHWTGSVPSELDRRYHATIGTKGMVVADDQVAAQWGAEVLRHGGNAVDAAVATAFALSVTRPHYASIGGGGFMAYCPAPQPASAVAHAQAAKGVASGDRAPGALAAGSRMPRPTCYTLDYREEAPGAATRDMYVRDGKPRTDLSQDGALASGVPGVTAGLLAALDRFGSMPRQKILSRPIELARRGFVFTGHEESTALDRWSAFNDESKRLFGCGAPGGHGRRGALRSLRARYAGSSA